MKIRGGAIVAKTLKKFGIDTIFSLPGHQTLAVFDACLDEGLNLISTRHELSALYMAEAMSYATQEIGVGLLAGGPELTDALTGLAKAFYANTPLLVIAGTNPPTKLDKGFPQDMDQLTIVRPFTKWCRCCYDIRRIPEYIHTAFCHALRGRPGPVYLEIPYDVMEEKIPLKDVDFPDKPPRLRACGEEGAMIEAVRLLSEAKRPLLIAGSGVFWSGAEAELATFVEKTRIPLFVTNAASAMSFPEELVAGIGSPGGGRFSLHALSQADVIFLLGTRLNFMLGFGQPPFISPQQKIIQLDIEPSEVGKNRAVDVGIVGDLKVTLKFLNDILRDFPSRPKWDEYLEKERQAFQKELVPLKTSKKLPIHPLRLIEEIEEVRSPDSILVLDGANSVLWAILGIRPRSQGQVLFSPSGDLEAIGAGIPHALALKHKYPDRDVILHTGDGSFGFCAMEIETAIRYGISFVTVIHNDQGWGMTRDMQIEFFGKNRQVGNVLGTVRYDRMVEALGGYGEFVEKPENIRPALERALASGLPACVNVMVDPKPQSPGLIMWILLEIMLGKTTYLDKLPDLVQKLDAWHLSGLVSPLLLKNLESRMHSKMK